jgi:hypothetical protein
MHVFWKRKNSCNSNFVQLLLLNMVKAKMDQKTVLLKVSLHKFVHLKFFWTQFKNVHLWGPCSLRPCISRPYCIQKLNDYKFAYGCFDARTTTENKMNLITTFQSSILEFALLFNKQQIETVTLNMKQTGKIIFSCWLMQRVMPTRRLTSLLIIT